MTLPSPDHLRQGGLDAMARGDFAAAAGLLMQAVQAQPGNSQNWLALALTLARAGDVAMLGQVAALWGNMRGDRFSALFDVFTVLMTYRLHDAVLALAAATGGDDPLAVPGLYYSGCVHILRDQEDAAFVIFSRFKDRVAALRDSLPIGPEHPFNIAYRQGTLIEDRPYVERLLAAPPPAPPEMAPVLPHMDKATPFVLMAACNGLYLDIFGDAYVRSVEDRMPDAVLHLHVIDPPPDLESRAQRLRAGLSRTVLNVSRETTPPRATATYYAASRFLIAGQVLDLYRRDLLISDIDIELILDPTPWHARLSDLTFACFAHPGFGPASRLAAGITHFSQDHGGRVAADIISRFVHSKLDIPWPHSWMLDQAALLSTVHWLRHARPDLSCGRFNTLFGITPEDVFSTQERDAEKDMALAAARGI